MAAISVALAIGHGLASAASSPVTPFGGSAPVLIAHIGRIEVDLQAANLSSLHRVPCIDAAAGSTCFIPASRISVQARKVEAAEP